MKLTESVRQDASARELDHDRSTAAAGIFVAVLLQADSHRFNGPAPVVGATAEIVSGALLADWRQANS
jgi:hypothetical protein